MSQNHRTLLEKTRELLEGPLRHARTAALAASLVPLASVAAAAANSAPCEFYSGGLGMSLVDPVPELLSSNRQLITTSTTSLSTKGRYVYGLSADGVTQVVLRISGAFIPDGLSGEQELTVTVLENETDPSESIAEDGGLGVPGSTCPGSGCEHHQVVVTTSCIDNMPQAFAIYRAPLDFARSGDDNSLAYRDVYIHIESPNGSADFPIRIVRPPVALIHGLWSDWKTWDDFSPLVTGRRTVDSRFSVLRVDYGLPVGSMITASIPAYYPTLRSRATGSSLGLDYNAPVVLQQVRDWMTKFKAGLNPSTWPVAAVQADAVGHSMGGLVARRMVLLPQFMTATYGQGLIHKLITLDTPHLGSPLATQLLQPEEAGQCLQTNFARFGRSFAFDLVTLKGATWSGAVGDLVDSPLSDALDNLTQSGPVTLRAALVGGVYSDFASLSFPAGLIRYFCDTPLAQSLTATGYPAVFSYAANDGMVTLTSQQNNLSLDEELQISDVLHSPGTRSLGLTGTSVLESSDVGTLVIKLLNTSVTNTTYFVELNP